ncbi:hypothetical protein D3C77_431620 [compost metagenome]
MLLGVSDYRDPGDFRTGPRRGRHQHQRQALAACLVGTVEVLQRLFAVDQQRHQLGRIQRAAAAQAEYAIRLEGTAVTDRLLDHRSGRIRHYLVEHGHAATRRFQHRAGLAGEAEFDDARVTDQQHTAHTQAAEDLADALQGTRRTDDARDTSEFMMHDYLLTAPRRTGRGRLRE